MIDKNIVFIDSEINSSTKKVMDLGVIKPNNEEFHSPVVKNFKKFIDTCEYICGHNIINHDLKFLQIPNKKLSIHYFFLHYCFQNNLITIF